MNSAEGAKKYDHKAIEQKWQKEWKEKGIYKTEDFSTKPKQYVLDMFPYPSGEGLHVGHPRGYIATDVYSRKKRMEGFNVLHPMGWDAFGLPAENFAIANKVHPRAAVEKNITRFKEQLSILGPDYDWSREINTTDPEFYKWTQWVFVQLFKKGLAYESNEPVNWCPTDKTVLANEDVEPDGTCERCGTKVEKKPMRQWVLKITDYADRMLADLDKLPKWPEGVKEAQRNWIGKSEGAEIDFIVEGQESHPLKVFTTRPDTIFGATFVAVSAGLAKEWLGIGWQPSNEVKEYIEHTLKEQEIRDFKEKEKTGIYAGFEVVNPATKEKIPVWIANYVLHDIGTGAIMAVPAHDERDLDFAEKYNLRTKEVVLEVAVPKGDYETVKNEAAFAVIKRKDSTKILLQFENKRNFWRLPGGSLNQNESPQEAVLREVSEETGYLGTIIAPLGSIYVCFEKLDKNEMHERRAYGFTVEIDEGKKNETNLTNEEVAVDITYEWVEPKKAIELLRSNTVLMGEAELVERYVNGKEVFTGYGIAINSGKFDGLSSEEAKLKIIEFVGGKQKSTYKIKDWVFSRQRYWGEPIPIIHCEKCGVVAVPEKDLPVLLPNVENYEPTGTGESPLAAIDSWVNTECPECGGAAKRETNTMPQWAGSSWYYLRYIDPLNTESLIDPKKQKEWLPVDVYVGGDHATRHLIYARFWHKFLFDIGVVSTEEPFPRLEFLGFILAPDGRKFGKRLKNGINPSDVVNQFGADAFRLYEMFIGPFENTAPWSNNGLVGTYRFIEKAWSISQKDFSGNTNQAIASLLHKTIKKVTGDIENFKFNTAVSALMIFVNECLKSNISESDYKILLQLLAPFAPHMTEELWHKLGETESIHLSPWPKYDPEKVIDDEISIGVQINGKTRAEILIKKEDSKEEIQAKALANLKVQEHLEGRVVKNVVVVPGRIVNIVLS